MPFQKGAQWKGNKNGRPKGAKEKFSIDALCKELQKWEKETGKNFYREMIEQALETPAIATILLNKLLPNATPIETVDPILEDELQLISYEQTNNMKSRISKYLQTGDNGGNDKGS